MRVSCSERKTGEEERSESTSRGTMIENVRLPNDIHTYGMASKPVN